MYIDNSQYISRDMQQASIMYVYCTTAVAVILKIVIKEVHTVHSCVNTQESTQKSI